MSTRANVVIKDKYTALIFYRHSDGYPEGALPTLKQFMEWVATGKIRNNVGQAAGWLILLGAEEYDDFYDHKGDFKPRKKVLKQFFTPVDWKAGAYEPTTKRHGDIEYLYILDLEKEEIRVYETPFDLDSKQSGEDYIKKLDKLIDTISFKKETVPA